MKSQQKSQTSYRFRSSLVAAAAASLLGAGIASAQTATNADKNMNAQPRTPMATQPAERSAVPPNTVNRNAADSDNAMANADKDMLEKRLQSVTTRTGYAKALQDAGFQISAINADKSDYLEYEVVKGGRSYEVQLDFDKGATKATEIDVAANVWRADATKRMMEDGNYRHAAPLAADPDSRYSDRRYMQAWTSEKEKLEQALPANLPVAQYKSKIEQMGYKITSVNDRDADSVEYEIVKGDNSYEVEIDLDAGTKLARSVDVKSNLWDSDATERAKDRNETVVGSKPAPATR